MSTTGSIKTISSVDEDLVPFVDLQAQVRRLQPDLKRAIDRVIGNCDFILGAAVDDFEAAFAKWLEVNHAVGVGNGLEALTLVLSALDVGPGDEVIVPVNSFMATALAVSRVGARPVFVDCNPQTYNIDVAQAEAAVTSQTRAIIPVHLTGQPAEMDPILDIARRAGAYVVEDAAQAHGARYHGQCCGTMGNAGCFSFYPGKNLGAFGDAGLIATNDLDLATKLRQLRNYGQRQKYEHVVAGGNSRMDTLQAAVLNVKLPYLSRWNAARNLHAMRYRTRLSGVGDLKMQDCIPDSTHVYHLFIIETADRDGLQHHLRNLGIQTGIHYPLPIHLQPAYADLGYRRGAFPVAERLAGRILSLPMYPEMSKGQLDRVVEGVRSWFAR